VLRRQSRPITTTNLQSTRKRKAAFSMQPWTVSRTLPSALDECDLGPGHFALGKRALNTYAGWILTQSRMWM
jgi:hypothetical protein